MRRDAVLCFAVTLAGCGVRIESPYELNDLKVVAVVAEPPAVVAGGTSTLRAYIAVGPNTAAEALQVAWEYCASHTPLDTNPDCAVPTPIPAAAPAALSAALVVVDAELTVPEALVSDVPLEILRDGFWLHVRLRVSAMGVPEALTLKRVVVNDPNTPRNSNPVLRKVDVWDSGVLTGIPHEAHANGVIELVPDYDAATFQPYTVLNSRGEREPRLESPQFAWYVTAGSLDAWTTQDDRTVLWRPGPWTAPVTHTFVSVLRDGRGGVAVNYGQVSVVP
jgi:hypothetical protein